MKRGARGPDAIDGILIDVLKRVDPEHQLPAYRIWTFWADEVGDAIARRTQPQRFRNGILFVTVATHTWMQELQFMKESLRERLNARLGAEVVRDLFFAVGPLTPDAPAEGAAAIVPPGSPLVALPEIAEPQLATAFARVVDARARRIAQSRAPSAHGRPRKSR